MPVIRVQKTKNYTVMANYHLRDKRLSFKAKGLMSFMLSLPEKWDYSITGLSMFGTDKIDSVRNALKELEKQGYVRVERVRDNKGMLRGTEYTVMEKPILENPTLEKPILEKPILENPTQLSTKEESTKEVSKEERSKEGVTASFSSSLGEIKAKWESTFHPLMKAGDLETLDAYIQDYGRMGVLNAIETAGKRKNLNRATLSPRYLLPILKNPTSKPEEPRRNVIPMITDRNEKEYWARLRREDEARQAEAKRLGEDDPYGIYGESS